MSPVGRWLWFLACGVVLSTESPTSIFVTIDSGVSEFWHPQLCRSPFSSQQCMHYRTILWLRRSSIHMYIKRRKLQLKQLKLAQYYLPCPLWIIFFYIIWGLDRACKAPLELDLGYTELFVSVFDHYETLRGSNIAISRHGFERLLTLTATALRLKPWFRVKIKLF